MVDEGVIRRVGSSKGNGGRLRVRWGNRVKSGAQA